ncbi:hypothetical protein HF086_015158 [Spodoptera exigua]|uniref:Gustatory receptor n=1 Tax=Spodoptera exigua TaxID=7107 RepID=A0A922MCL9_SPOEX|nr:hypothetical protein HF086_015158 [Spodoptera exigua]
MRNLWNTVISSIGVGSVNTVNSLFKSWRKIAPTYAMDLYSLEKFKKYKKDWSLEHGFSELHGISIALDCHPEKPLYETFMRDSFAWLFLYLPYNDFIGFLSHFFNIQCTFNWNFSDVFVICMSMYLTARLEQVNQRIIAAKDKVLRFFGGYEHAVYFAFSFLFLVVRSLTVSLTASKIAGTIVTYELVLMQFTGITPSSPEPG